MDSHVALPIISRRELHVDNIVVKPLEQDHTDGNISSTELAIISQLVLVRKPYVILEIGTFDGRTTLNLAHHTPPDTLIYTIDLQKEEMERTRFPLYAGDEVVGSDRLYIGKEESGARYKRYTERWKIVQLYGDSATFDFVGSVGQADFIFIDGSHAKDYVRNDTEVALKLLRGGRGTILWHDYGIWKDVTDVLNDFYLHDCRLRNLRNIEGTTFGYFSNEYQGWNERGRFPVCGPFSEVGHRI